MLVRLVRQVRPEQREVVACLVKNQPRQFRQQAGYEEHVERAELCGNRGEQFLQAGVVGLHQDLRVLAHNCKSALDNGLDPLAAEQAIKMQVVIVQHQPEDRFTDAGDERRLPFLLQAKEARRIRQHKSSCAGQHAAEDQFRPVTDVPFLDQVCIASLADAAGNVRTQRRGDDFDQLLHLGISRKQLAMPGDRFQSSHEEAAG